MAFPVTSIGFACTDSVRAMTAVVAEPLKCALVPAGAACACGQPLQVDVLWLQLGHRLCVPVGVSGAHCSVGILGLENPRSPQPILVSALHGAVLKPVPAL